MKVDYTYIEIFFKVLEGHADIKELEDTPGYQTILAHARHTGNDFTLKDLDHAIRGVSDQAYGLRHLMDNLEKIKDLYQQFKVHEDLWLDEIKTNLNRLFDGIDHGVTTICPVIGYDIGIGMDQKVCVNLNSGICLENYRELISIMIHEVAHTYYEAFHGSMLVDKKLETQEDMMAYLSQIIHYEGVGVFAAEAYRTKHQLPNSGSPIQEDYWIASCPQSHLDLVRVYKELVADLMDDKVQDEETFYSRTFNKWKLPHRLGYSIFTRIHKNKGLEGVKESLQMTSTTFERTYLCEL